MTTKEQIKNLRDIIDITDKDNFELSQYAITGFILDILKDIDKRLTDQEKSYNTKINWKRAMKLYKEKTVIKAIEGSISKWEKIVTGNGVDDGYENYPLCKLFITCNCVGCPIVKFSGVDECSNSQYFEWIRHQRRVHNEYNGASIVHCDKCKMLAEQELKFLRLVLEAHIRNGIS